MIHLALADDGTVYAQFLVAAHAAEFCAAHNYCHVPFNAVRYSPVPGVGSVYRTT